MRNTKSIKCGVALLLAVFAQGASAAPYRPEMQAALANLQKANAELRAAPPDIGGHRANAIKLVEAAIAEVEAGIRYDRQHNDEYASTVALAPAAAVDQPHVQTALDALRDARMHLDAATPDRDGRRANAIGDLNARSYSSSCCPRIPCGYRVKAIEDVNKAIDEVQKGIEFNRTH